LSTAREPAGANKHSLSLLAIGGGGGAFTVTATEQIRCASVAIIHASRHGVAPAAAPVVSRATVEPVRDCAAIGLHV